MRTTPSWGPTILRVAFGVMVAAHGSQKLFGWFNGPGIDGFAGYLSRRGVELAEPAAWATGIVEVGCGLLLVVGFQVRVACLPLICAMAMAIRIGHAGRGFFAQSGGWEYPAMCASVFIALLVMGGGAMSLDERFSGSTPRR